MEDTLKVFSNHSKELRHHLHNPIFINKKIWRLKISMHNGRMACVQVIHSLGLQKIRQFAQEKRSKPNTPERETIQLIPHQEPSAFASFHQLEDWDDAVIYTNSPCTPRELEGQDNIVQQNSLFCYIVSW